LGILISDLYLYGIKIQTNIKQNSVEKYAGKSQIFENVFLIFFWTKPKSAQLSTGQDSAQPRGLG
jgi:hypothetical protein